MQLFLAGLLLWSPFFLGSERRMVQPSPTHSRNLLWAGLKGRKLPGILKLQSSWDSLLFRSLLFPHLFPFFSCPVLCWEMKSCSPSLHEQNFLPSLIFLASNPNFHQAERTDVQRRMQLLVIKCSRQSYFYDVAYTYWKRVRMVKVHVEWGV